MKPSSWPLKTFRRLQTTFFTKIFLTWPNVARFHDVDEEDFEFSLVNADEHVSDEDTASEGPVVFPLFNIDLLITNEADREATAKVDDEENACSTSLGKLFINEQEESALSSSSEADEYESEGCNIRNFR
ncbi:hypothetical protein L6452_05002 [Arctium lappa]|uniref:Uncharacterized protein n=1 Tax=Arctium lappa TaxID=4217 RepID=A0ACB9EFI0_ARCLA|nr:hypothetical protein L6452_05002 [Arctium lappa]